MSNGIKKMFCCILAFMMVMTAGFFIEQGTAYADEGFNFYNELSYGLTNAVYDYLDEVYIEKYPEMGLRIKYGTDKEKQELKVLSDMITEGKTSDMEKAMAINRWVKANLTYEGSSPFPIDTLRSRTGVCLNYAVLSSTLLRLAGIPSVVVDGYRGNMRTVEQSNLKNTSHAWLYAYIDGHWVMFDPLWAGGTAYMDDEAGREYLASFYLISTIEGIHMTYDGMDLYDINFFSSSRGDGAVYHDGKFMYAVSGRFEENGYSPQYTPGNNVFTLNYSIHFPFSLRLIHEGGIQDGNHYLDDEGDARRNQMVANQLYADGWIINGSLNYLYENGVAKTSAIEKYGDDTVYFTKSGTALTVDPAIDPDDYWTENGDITFRTGTSGQFPTFYGRGLELPADGYKYKYSLYTSYGDDCITITEDGHMELLKAGSYDVIIRTISLENGSENGYYNITVKAADERPVPDYSTKTLDIENYNIELSSYEYMYDGEEKCPEVTVYETTLHLDGEYPRLKEGEDYTVEYVDNVLPGFGKVVVTGKGIFSGRAEQSFFIGHEHVWDEGTEPDGSACENEWVKNYHCTLCDETKWEVMQPLGHDWGEWEYDGYKYVRSCKRCGRLDFKQGDPGNDPGTDPDPGNDPGTDPDPGNNPGADPDPGNDPGTDPGQGGEPVTDTARYFGSTRYETSLKAADAFRNQLGLDKFDSVILACGSNYADALAGSYLSSIKKAPILLVDTKPDHINAVKNYIKANLNPGGTIYQLGGPAVVPDNTVEGLSGYNVKRLWGNDRYATNVAILEEAGISGKEVLVASGTGLADSLSASATGKPILLVKNTIQPSQKNFVASLSGKKFYIIGGSGAVNTDIEKYFRGLGTAVRIGGSDRYETSVNVARTFFKEPKGAVLAYGANFPDGLCGGSLANAMGGPLLLVANGKADKAAAYAKEYNIQGGAVLGGQTLINDSSMNMIFVS